jgi:hypothetical protein
MFYVVILALAVGVASEGTSPHAEYILQQYGNDPNIDPNIIEDATLDVVSLKLTYLDLYWSYLR